MRFSVLFLAVILLGSWACNSVAVNQDSSTAQTVSLADASPKKNYRKYCAGCHGDQMQAFVDRRWVHGNTEADLVKAIKYGYDDEGMPAFDTTFTDAEIKALANYIQEGIKNVERYDFKGNFDFSKVYQAHDQHFKVEPVLTDLEIPWGITFLPNGDMLLTERGGGFYRINDRGDKMRIENAPEVLSRGQGGLLDVELHPDFANNQLIYLSYSDFKRENGERVSTTQVMRARLANDRLVDNEVIFTALPYSTRRHHYGSRLEFDLDGYLYISVGDRGNRDRNPQNLDNHCGKIHRLNDDGSIPSDNPFVGQGGAMESIYSYGHRNPQGMSRQPGSGTIWTHEHGPRGGDELNPIQKGVNYGWPTISYGINYNGTTFTDKTAQEGMTQPVHYWVPSIAPCGMTFVRGDHYPSWQGDLLIGSLRFEYLNLCVMQNDKVVEEIQILKNIGRVRVVEMSPSGFIYVGVEEPGAVYRLVPLDD